MMTPRLRVASLTSAVLLAATTAHAQVVGPDFSTPVGTRFFDFFFGDNGGQPANNYNFFLQWSVTDLSPGNTTAGSVDLVGGMVPGFDRIENGGRYVDLRGVTGEPALFSVRNSLMEPTSPPFLFTAGVTYNLSFRYVSVDGLQNSATATIGTQLFSVSTTSTSFLDFSRDFTFATDTSTNLTFLDAGQNGGTGIDAVVLRTVPEPGSFVLLALGGVALGAGWLGRRRRQG